MVWSLGLMVKGLGFMVYDGSWFKV